MSPLSASSWLTAWTFSPFGVVLAIILLVPYVAGLLAARRRGHSWPWWRTASYLVLGVGTLLYVTCGPVGVYRDTFFWMFAAQVAVVGSVTPAGLAIGDPIGLFSAATGRTDTWVHRAVRSPVARFFMFPLVSTALDLGGILAVFYTGYAKAAIDSDLVGALLLLQLLFVGLIFVLPVLADDLLPRWATPPVRTFLAFLDGLVDAIPGVLLMTANSLLVPSFPGFSEHAAHLRDGISASLDQQYAGGALLVVAETIGLPMLGAVFAEWLRADAAEARAADALLDARDAADAAAAAGGITRSGSSRMSGSSSRSGDPGSGPRMPGGAGVDSDAPDLPEPDAAAPPESAPAGAQQPWWLTDPRMADRFGHSRHDPDSP
ncbi:cytochrome c oxidase assembly protein [Rudaeicoccus suwonensis]|uniref:Putative copper resistance protein D n=1 Tax=Rudaeicoccus suwonensis TaxID=657409 RepID=A0A561ECP3_9MICO|nr:cytochrome c oxidase assembly protein [Rudaeicoccus suwonensis]TWE13385.1 putative copper resistance protein D [Rudaeicoccus suwonensis]